jgi:phosphohistidine phosphatase
MRSEALGMKNLKLSFDLILSSPYVRARQTAGIVAQAYKIKDRAIHYTENLLPPATIEELLDEAHASFPGSQNILLVGHEPYLTEMISSLLDCRQPLGIELKKGGLCCLSIRYPLKKNSAILNWLLTPAQLHLLDPSL